MICFVVIRSVQANKCCVGTTYGALPSSFSQCGSSLTSTTCGDGQKCYAVQCFETPCGQECTLNSKPSHNSLTKQSAILSCNTPSNIEKQWNQRLLDLVSQDPNTVWIECMSMEIYETSSSRSSAGVIGGIMGGLAGALGVGIALYCRRKRSHPNENVKSDIKPSTLPVAYAQPLPVAYAQPLGYVQPYENATLSNGKLTLPAALAHPQVQAEDLPVNEKDIRSDATSSTVTDLEGTTKFDVGDSDIRQNSTELRAND